MVNTGSGGCGAQWSEAPHWKQLDLSVSVRDALAESCHLLPGSFAAVLAKSSKRGSASPARGKNGKMLSTSSMLEKRKGLDGAGRSGSRDCKAQGKTIWQPPSPPRKRHPEVLQLIYPQDTFEAIYDIF